MNLQNKIFNLVKWLVLIATYGFLIYKFSKIKYWDDLLHYFPTVNSFSFIFFVVVMLMMPINWWLEAKKWQILTSYTTKLKTRNAIKSVLSGLTTGYITPNRIGEFAGRIQYLPKEKQWEGIGLSIMNGITQTMIISSFGIISALFYFLNWKKFSTFQYYLLVVFAILILLFTIYFFFPKWIKKYENSEKKWMIKFIRAAGSISDFTINEHLGVLGISAIRYFVFVGQYLLMLLFLQIDVSFYEAILAISTTYLIITFTPSFTVTEPAIRGSAAVLVFGAITHNEIGIILASVLLWIVNFVIPLLIGSILIGKLRKQQ